jgi:hypothetical protein
MTTRRDRQPSRRSSDVKNVLPKWPFIALGLLTSVCGVFAVGVSIGHTRNGIAPAQFAPACPAGDASCDASLCTTAPASSPARR